MTTAEHDEADQIAEATQGIVWWRRIPVMWRLVRARYSSACTRDEGR